jgi:hypothetical protein
LTAAEVIHGYQGSRSGGYSIGFALDRDAGLTAAEDTHGYQGGRSEGYVIGFALDRDLVRFYWIRELNPKVDVREGGFGRIPDCEEILTSVLQVFRANNLTAQGCQRISLESGKGQRQISPLKDWRQEHGKWVLWCERLAN